MKQTAQPPTQQHASTTTPSPFFTAQHTQTASKTDEPFFNPNPQNPFFTARPSSATIQTKASTETENKTGLPDGLKKGVEQISGMDISDVSVHYNSHLPTQFNAHAYAQGTDIHVATGQEKHLPHEAWHVVQQKQGRVQPTRQMKRGVAVNDDLGLEKEADAMGAKALQNAETQTSTPSVQKASAASKPVMQWQLTELTEKNLEARAKGMEESVEDLKMALFGYELDFETDPIETAKSFNAIIQVFEKSRKALGAKADNSQSAEEKATIETLLEWLYAQETDLMRERHQLILALPLVRERESLLGDFKDYGRLSIYEGIKQIYDSEPKLYQKPDPKSPKVAYADDVKSKPFSPDGPTEADVKQGLLGDCWLLAPLISLVNTPSGKARIRDMIQPNNKSAEAYTVSLSEPDERRAGQFLSRSIVVTASFPTFQTAAKQTVFAYAHLEHPIGGQFPLWPLILEKAFAILFGKDYGKLSGNPSRIAFEYLLGRDVYKDRFDILEQPQEHLEGKVGGQLGNPMNVETVKALIQKGAMVVVANDDHYWSVKGVSKDDLGLDLRNPHGKDEFKGWAELSKFTYEAVKR